MRRIFTAVRAMWTRLYRPPQMTSAWLRVQAQKELTEGYEGVSCQWEDGARWNEDENKMQGLPR